MLHAFLYHPETLELLGRAVGNLLRHSIALPLGIAAQHGLDLVIARPAPADDQQHYCGDQKDEHRYA
jgi:hypothetical protein